MTCKLRSQIFSVYFSVADRHFLLSSFCAKALPAA